MSNRKMFWVITLKKIENVWDVLLGKVAWIAENNILDYSREVLKEIDKCAALGPQYGKSRRHKLARADVLATRNP